MTSLPLATDAGVSRPETRRLLSHRRLDRRDGPRADRVGPCDPSPLPLLRGGVVREGERGGKIRRLAQMNDRHLRRDAPHKPRQDAARAEL